MSFADSKEIARQIAEVEKTHFVVKLVTPAGTEYRQMSRDNPDRLVFNFLPADMMHKATVYAAGAKNPLTHRQKEFPAIPSFSFILKKKRTGKKNSRPSHRFRLF